MVVDDTVLQQPCRGLIRTEDVYPPDVDVQVEMHKCFHPGDVVRAQILSLGDARQYYLSTAQVELGVSWTRGEGGEVMLPVSWNEVRGAASDRTEERKCARPQL